jgi:prepilin-type processing-associated H-X9-DG protein
MPGLTIYHWGPYGRAMRYFDEDGKTRHLAGGYTYNGYLLRKHPSGNDDTLGDEASAGGGQAADRTLGWSRLWIPPVRGASEVPAIADGTWPNGWPKESDTTELVSGSNLAFSLYAPAGPGPNMNIGNDWRRVLVSRHGRAINVGFMDGHASTVDLMDLFKLRWHKHWNVRLIDLNTISGAIKNAYKR